MPWTMRSAMRSIALARALFWFLVSAFCARTGCAGEVGGLPDVAVDDQVLLLEALGQLELVIVHQCRVRDDNQWGADAQYLADRSGAWDEA